MKNKLKDKLGIIDELENLQAIISFMNQATGRIAEHDYPLGEQMVFGMQLVFDCIQDRLEAVSDVLETANLTMGGVR